MKRNILIVEDNPRWLGLIKELCEQVLSEIHNNELLQNLYIDRMFPDDIGYSVITAMSLTEAKQIFEMSFNRPQHTYNQHQNYISLLVLDIRLNDATLGTTEGWELLNHLRKSQENIATIVVSGENSPERVLEGLQSHDALQYFTKQNFSDEAFLNLVKFSLLYDDAVRLLDSWQWVDTKTSYNLWKDHIAVIEQRQKDKFGNRPKYKINVKDEFDKRVDSLTKIPNSAWSKKVMRSLLDRENWIFVSITIKGLEDFATLRGSQHADEVRKFMADILDSTIQDLGNATDFVGHADGEFILVSTPDKIEKMWKRIETKFRMDISNFYEYKDKEQGEFTIEVNGKKEKKPFMTAIKGWITDKEGPFYSTDDLTERVAKQKY